MFIKKILSLSLYLISGVSCLTVSAQSYIPKDNDFVLDSWQVNSNKSNQTSASLTDIENLLEQAQYPGKSAYNVGRANALLKPHLKQDVSGKAWYLSARILQHQHQFQAALKDLDKSISKNKSLTSAWLLKANIHLALAQYSQARSACVSLLGQADMLTVASCSLEVESYQNKLKASYQQLTELVERYGLPDDESQVWILQILADMAHRLGQNKTAITWLEQYSEQLKPMSLLVLWSDIQLENNNAEAVDKQLSEVVNHAEFKDDALLLRLAIAEKQMNTGTYWAEQTLARIQLRIQRNDRFHASEIARFYIDIAPNPSKALHWAEENWRMTKLAADKKLLEAAVSMQGSAMLPEPPSGMSAE
ncbi:tetratricopeptide repeat protein [Catenovulum adriaticum]|uniref:Tetratricopeptide repeat protein n=1 Tax=Catenovulum adriaticum TaxID=2984846 RepID=A0ABY7ALL1_9ALTE|nr:hypothetical protein [Catenovulum sp. TS8]WAJ70438.1 hypothetical protein OLW01_01065 [Catenovulum sp. TS8]